MNELEERRVQCPYCGEEIDVLIDCAVQHQRYIEDCQVCCRPINFDIAVINNGELIVRVSHEDEG